MMRAHSRWLFPVLSLPVVLAWSVGGAWAGDTSAKPATFSFHDANVLGTSMDLQVSVSSEQDADKVHKAVAGEVERLRKILSTYDASTEISKVNASRAPVVVSQELIDVLRMYEQWQAKASGTYSAGLGDMLKMWSEAEKSGKLPDKSAMAAAVEKARKPLWRIDDAARTVQRLGDDTINVDSMGKGFIVSHAANLARAQVSTVRGILLNIGGDITVLGSSSMGGFVPWTISVADPAKPEDNAPPLTQLHASAVSIATSGNYARGYSVGGKKFSHLLDPRTGAPVDFIAAGAPGVVSATAIAQDNATANALAASLCVLSPEQGLALAHSSGAECLLVLADGTQKRSVGFKRYEAPEPGKSPVVPAPGKAADRAPASKVPEAAAATGGNFPAGYQVSIPLELKAARNHAYCAVWVEDEKGGYVKTLMVWGNEQKYLRAMDAWWKLVQKKPDVLATATRATRTAGKYPLAWDGTDDKGKAVAQGKYRIFVQTAVWRDPPTVKESATINCGTEKSTAALNSTKHMEELTLTYAPKGG